MLEDREVSELMNRHFICVKIDREERPDIDHLYMDAPSINDRLWRMALNIVALPDGRRFGALPTCQNPAGWQP